MRGENKRNIVMVADDDLFMRKVIRSALQDMAEIIEVSDGDAVEAAYLAAMPDLLFLDVHLPGVSGLELLRVLTKKDVSAYIIMISADSTPVNVQQAKYRGSRGFLTKPFEKHRLLHIFQNCPTVRYHD